ncbi:uncharacterized protein LOC111084971 [Limulus polyphemus]|uniref:Uncharacterized protein LOC111084971 n=1 Tax=Limulus polyphemus TaxID=6850 RepID=A0ABM1S1C0_LIMPO|nr:uncharacterized protein LOC111084971 [Limulus polyphemus]
MLSLMAYIDENRISIFVEGTTQAYPKRPSSAPKIVSIISLTLVMMTILIGVFVLLGFYVQLRQAECDCGLEKVPQPFSLESIERQSKASRYDPDPLLAVPSQSSKKMTAIPLRLHLDGDTGRMIKKKNKARVSCDVEKKKTMALTAQKPKTLITPFGNITTDPRLIHVMGERMVFSCHSDMRNTHKPVNDYKEIPSRSRRDTSNMYDCDCTC